MKFKNRFGVTSCFFICCLLLPSALYSQDFSFIGKDMEHLEVLITNTLLSMEEHQKLLEDLQENLNKSENLIGNYETIINRQEILLTDLQTQLIKMSEIYRKQSALSEKYAKNSKFWRTFTLIAVPAAAALSGSLVWASLK